MKREAVVILNWNGKDLLKQFLPALIRHTPLADADIMVADNGSTDDSLAFLKAHYPEIRIRELGENYGFAAGYNRALADLDYEYVVLLNSDVEVTHDWFSLAINHLDTFRDISALQPKILSYKTPSAFEYAGACGGFADVYGYPFCRGRLLNTVETDGGQYDDPANVLWASGACLFIRLQDWKEAGGLDANFFAHQEEIDLCWRLNARGKKIVCLPQAVVYHVGGATLGKENPQKTYLNFRNNLLMLYKNLPDRYLHPVMRTRFFLDYFAALRFLLLGEWKNAFTVWKARRDFHRLKKQYQTVREENLRLSSQNLPDTVFRQNLLWQYYFKNKKKYSSL